MNKAQLRLQLKNCLCNLSAREHAEKSKRACQNLIALPEFQAATVVMIYLSVPNEVDTAPAILHAWQQGKTVVVPKVSWQQRHIIPVQIHSLETGFSTEAGGLKNPVTAMPIPIQEIDLVVTPGLGFDRKGNRLGRGGSYYDNFFDNPQLSAPKCGLAFAEQLIDSIPTDEHDKPLDLLVTDKEIIYFNVQGDKNGSV